MVSRSPVRNEYWNTRFYLHIVNLHFTSLNIIYTSLYPVLFYFDLSHFILTCVVDLPLVSRGVLPQGAGLRAPLRVDVTETLTGHDP